MLLTERYYQNTGNYRLHSFVIPDSYKYFRTLNRTIIPLCILATALTGLPSSQLFSQHRCATVHYNQSLHKKFGKTQQLRQFEQWIGGYTKKIAQSQARLQQTHAGPYKVPVVIHVIHRGEPLGLGTNISDEQIFSQIKVLNNDFKRLNADAPQTPAIFQSLAGSMDIEFVLARIAPNGMETNGIVRLMGSKNSWVQSDDALLKSQSYWPSQDYLNIWVCNLTDFLGYAQFPVSDLEGLEEFQNEIAATDGVVIGYDVFGSIDDGDFDLLSRYNKGRTLTHEMGHFFGLRHIWGDENGCVGTDYVSDTPNQSSYTDGCPAHPRTSCTTTNMFQNFMDYTNDVCMNLFTQGQVDRMQTVLENSIRRASLLSSPGLGPPNGTETNDVAVTAILSPEPVSCEESPQLEVQIQNRGTALLNSVLLAYSINGGPSISTYMAFNALTRFSSTILSVPIALATGENLINMTLSMPNDTDDIDLSNNSLNKVVAVNESTEPLPARERFEKSFADRWTIVSPDGTFGWRTVATNYGQSPLFADSVDLQKKTSWLVSPVFDFSQLIESNLRFDYSFNEGNDNPLTLRLKYSTDCGRSFTDLPGFVLTETSSRPVPVLDSDWESVVVSLEPLLGSPQGRIAFVASTSNIQSVFIDNIELYAGEASPRMAANEGMAVYPNIENGINITFNAATLQTARVSIIDLFGQTVIQGDQEKVLNQTISLSLPNLQTGIYIVRVKTDNRYYNQKVFIPGR